VILQVTRTRRVVGDSRNQGDGYPSCSRSHNTRQRPQEGSVPDRRSQIIPEVVLVRRWAVGVLGNWRGEGLGEGWGKGGQFTSNLRPRWTDPVTARRVPSK
jgi:hypothetical protein